MYFYVGGEGGRDVNFNGSGYGEAPGGGATDIRLYQSNWNDFNSLKSRIMVAAGGGGGTFQYPNVHYLIHHRGDGGALSGYDADICIYYYNDSPETCETTGKYGYGGHGATQTSGGMPGKNTYLYPTTSEMTGGFGVGGYQGDYKLPNEDFTYHHSSSGGGGGYYGGGHGTHPGSEWPGGGGGSSFISGYNGCNAISSESTALNIIHTNQPNHYSGMVFENAVMKSGDEEMPFYKSGTQIGNDSNGYARITYLG